MILKRMAIVLLALFGLSAIVGTPLVNEAQAAKAKTGKKKDKKGNKDKKKDTKAKNDKKDKKKDRKANFKKKI